MWKGLSSRIQWALSTQEGSCMHVDGIRTLASSITSLEEQIAIIVEEFASHNYLMFNAQKCGGCVLSGTCKSPA